MDWAIQHVDDFSADRFVFDADGRAWASKRGERLAHVMFSHPVSWRREARKSRRHV